MKDLINFDDVNNKIITIREQSVILDSDVAMLYGVKTMRINEAVRNNPDKFPEGYVFELTPNEKQEAVEFFENRNTGPEWHVVENLHHMPCTFSVAHSELENPNTSPEKDVIENFDNMPPTLSVAHSEKIKRSPTLPKAFTEKGLYMLATILKSPQATQTTLAIVEAFTKIRELSRAVVELAQAPEDEQKQLSIMQKSGEILSDIIRNDLKTTSTETSFELNLLAMLKLKHTIKREKD